MCILKSFMYLYEKYEIPCITNIFHLKTLKFNLSKSTNCFIFFFTYESLEIFAFNTWDVDLESSLGRLVVKEFFKFNM